MFLHKKSAQAPVKRLKTAVKLDFGASGEDLRSSCNALKDGKRIVSRFLRREKIFFCEPWQTVAANGDLVYVTCEEGLYSMRGSAMYWLSDDASHKGCGCVYRGDFVFSAKEMGTYFLTYNRAHQVYEKGFSSLTVCADRIFGLSDNEVYYTVAGERDGWADGEMITLPTSCDALVTVGDKVYVLGNTCYSISPKADDIEFKCNVLAKNIGAVSTCSPVTYNGSAVFASSNGLYEICLDKITPIFTQLCDAIDFSTAVGAMFEGKYYVSCRSKNSGEQGNDVTLILDLEEEEIAGVFDIGFDSMCPIVGTIYAVHDGHFYWITDGKAQGRFVKSKIDFGTKSKKFLDRLTVTTLNDLDVTIRSESETRLYKIKGKKTAQKINLRDMGWEFSIKLTSNDGLDVENVELEAHVCEEV